MFNLKESEQELITRLRTLESGKIDITVVGGEPTKALVYNEKYTSTPIPSTDPPTELESLLISIIRQRDFGQVSIGIVSGFWNGVLLDDSFTSWLLK